MRPSFLTQKRPYVAAIVQEKGVEATIANILNSEHDGAEGFMVDLSYLTREERSSENLQRVFHSTGRPIMPLLYRTQYMGPEYCSDEERAEEMLLTLEMGATAIDVMGDLFCPDKRELTKEESAIARQKELISRIHEKGGEVLISSHMPDVLTAEEVLEHLMCQADRGADIAKIIVGCNTEEDLLESIRTTILLKKEMKIPFIHLCNGKLGRLQRFIAPMLGSMLTFGIERFNPQSLGAQPTIASAKAVLHEMTWHLNWED